MNTDLSTHLPQRSRIHPLVAGAAVSVILASLTGVAAMTGVLPLSHATSTPSATNSTPPITQAPTTTATVAAPLASNATQQPVVTQPTSTPPRVHHTHRPAAPRYVETSAPAQTSVAQPVAAAVDPYAGEIVAINAVQSPQPTTGLGAVGGAVAGGLLGNQIGAGRGRLLATVAGAVGGGFAGNGIEHAVRKQTSYQVQVRMQDGSYRNFNYTTQPALQIGERVHVSGDSLSAS